MRLETYSLDFEDLILFAMLHEIRDGFYIDVGANDPSINSVTKIFYDRGWSGINIEPLRSRCKLLEEFRPRDINLCIGIGSESDEKIFYEIPELDILSSFSEEVARENAEEMIRANSQSDFSKREIIRESSRKIMTLTEVFRSYCDPQQPVHFCKIDVEGFEHEVLLGVKNWQKFRPWIFCIESHEPTEEHPEYLIWEKILIDAGYQFMFNFGINRFYVDSRKNHLSKNLVQIREFLSQHEIFRVNFEPLTITS
ncbi:MAG: FkbM family methyltransferase [Selenomonadaceae bacterium]|nr:FkbM family methyltransferase [Selenomonadaceae bacterium]